MKKITLINKIKQLGFSDYETKCYLALCKRNSMSVSETSKLAEIPRSNAYEALEKLLSKGMVVSIPGNVKRYAASDPVLLKDKAIVEFKRSIENDLQELESEKQKILSREFKADAQLDTAINELNTIYEASRDNNEPLEFIEVMKTGKQIDNTFSKLQMKCKKEVLTFTKQRISILTEKQIKILDSQVKLGVELLKKGIKLRTIYEISGNEKDDKRLCEGYIDVFHKAGEQVKVMKELPMRMAIFDEKAAMYTLVNERAYDIEFTQVVRHPVMAKSLKIMFESLWNKAEDYNDYLNRLKIKK